MDVALFVIIYSSEITPTQHLRRLWVRCCNAISATAVVGSAKWKVCEYTKHGSVKRASKKAGATSVKQCTHSISLFFIEFESLLHEPAAMNILVYKTNALKWF